MQCKLFKLFSAVIFNVCLLTSANVNAQFVPVEKPSRLVAFLDELNNMRVFDESIISQPVSRRYAYQILLDVDTSALNARQRKERRFYLKSLLSDAPSEDAPNHSPELRNVISPLERYKESDALYYHSNQVSLVVNPIIGADYYSNQNSAVWQRRIGGDFKTYIGKFGVYASVRDVYERLPLYADSILGPQEGALYKYNSDGSAEFSEARGGVTYGGEWGYVGLIRDKVKWGYGSYGTNILDDNAPPFVHIKLHMNPVSWLKFDYLHGFLQSDVIDSSSITTYANVTTFGFEKKYISSNMVSFRPWKPFWVSLGNSIVYSGETVEPAYLLPLMFYKSVDHYLNGRNNRAGGNAQMFGAVSLRPGKGLHLYSTLFIDELSLRRAFDPTLHSNWFSFKGGMKWSNFLPNLSATAEVLRTNPMVYKHFVPTTTYKNASYNLGHYLRDNARELALGINYIPFYWLEIRLNYVYAEKGPNYTYDLTQINPNTNRQFVLGLPFLNGKPWIESKYRISVNMRLTSRLMFSTGVVRINRPAEVGSYRIAFYAGNTTTYSFGLNYGF